MANALSQIQHIVVVMFENRSFDNMLGYLYPPSQADFEGVAKAKLPNLWNNRQFWPQHGTDMIQPFPDPNEEPTTAPPLGETPVALQAPSISPRPFILSSLRRVLSFVEQSPSTQRLFLSFVSRKRGAGSRTVADESGHHSRPGSPGPSSSSSSGGGTVVAGRCSSQRVFPVAPSRIAS